MDILLEQAQQTREKSMLAATVSSPGERQILTLLRGATHPRSIEEVRHELLSSLSELQIQTAIINLLREGMIETVYTQEFKLGLTLAFTTS